MSNSEITSEELKKAFGKWIQLQRKAAGLYQKEVAEAVPMDRVHLARIESGTSGSTRDTITSIVKAINRKADTGHKIDVNEALDRFYGRWEEKSDSQNKVSNKDSSYEAQVQELAKSLEGFADGLEKIESPEDRAALLDDLKTIAGSMIDRELAAQERRKRARIN